VQYLNINLIRKESNSIHSSNTGWSNKVRENNQDTPAEMTVIVCIVFKGAMVWRFLGFSGKKVLIYL